MPVKKEVQQVERWFFIAKTIPVEPQRINTKEIISRLKRDYSVKVASPRTIQRDLEAMERVFKFRVDDSKKPYRYFFPKNADFGINKMSHDVALGLIFAEKYIIDMLPESSIDHLVGYFKRAKETLNEKRLRYSEWDKRVAINPNVYPISKAKYNKNFLLDIYNSILEQTTVVIEYLTRKRNADRRELYPQGVILTDNTSYLLASKKGEENQIKQYALHRIISLEKGESKLVSVNGFDVHKYIDNGGLEVPIEKCSPEILEVVFDEAAANHLGDMPLSSNQELIRFNKSKVKLVASTMISHQVKWWLLGFGEQVEVIKPESLRHEFEKITKQMYKKYHTNDNK